MLASQSLAALGYALLALHCLFLSRRLLRQSTAFRLGQRLWVAGFASAALVWALSGAALVLAQSYEVWRWIVREWLLRGTIVVVGTVSAALFAAMVLVATAAGLRRKLLTLVWLKFLAYTLWSLFYPSLAYAVMDYVVAMVLVLLLYATPEARRQAPTMRWIATGILVSFAALALASDKSGLWVRDAALPLAQGLAALACYLLWRGAMQARTPVPANA